MQKLKILYYNWVDFEEEERGGGVSIYQRNLVDAGTRQGDDVWFLSSGVSYSPFSRRPFLREVKARKEGVRKFEIVNSTLLSPGHEAFGVDVADAPAMDTAFADFLREHGPFDVIHFNNLEGIPVSFLRLAREHYPQTKVIYSVHNYFAFCPQVNLWFQEKASCQDFRNGKKCVNCLMKPANPRGTRRLYQMEYCLRKLGVGPQSVLYRLAAWLVYGPVRTLYRLAKTAARGDTVLAEVLPDQRRGSREDSKPTAILDPVEAARFARRRRRFVDALNTYADHILAVSQRVAELTVSFGIDPTKVQTLYIGTRFAPSASHCPQPAIRPTENRTAGGGLRMAYLG